MLSLSERHGSAVWTEACASRSRPLRGAARVAAALLVGLALSPAVDADAAFPGRGGEIAFSRGSGGHQIYVVEPDGAHVRRLPQSATNNAAPAFSADGKRIVFVRYGLGVNSFGHIALMSAGGEHVRSLTDGPVYDGTPHFGPDRHRVVFSRQAGHETGIYTVGARGRHLRKLAPFGSAPSYSPDGRRIVFIGNPGDRRGVFVMDRDGSHRHQLTNDPLTAPDGAGNRERIYVDSAPDFSPDGHQILFQRGPGYCPAGEGDIYVMRADGHRPHAITHKPGAACGDYAAAVFSPSGRRIAAASSAGVVVMHVDGTAPRALAHTRNAYGAPSWRPRPPSG